MRRTLSQLMMWSVSGVALLVASLSPVSPSELRAQPAPEQRPSRGQQEGSRAQSTQAPAFNHERAWRDLKEIVTRGQRYYGAPQRPSAIQDLARRLREAGAEVSLQAFKQHEPGAQREYQLTNIIGRIAPQRERRILLGSHWDTRLWAEEDADDARRGEPITGANDGSSGVAVLLEVARQIEQLSLGQLGIDIVFFDGEEFGRPGSNDYCAGSRYLAKRLHELYPNRPPLGVIVIDMVGDRDLSFPPEQSSVAKARSLTTLIWREGVRLKAPAFLRGLGLEDTSGPRIAPRGKWIIDDHTPFQELNIPATLIIDLEYPQWHTHQDTLDRVSAESLRQTGEVLLASLKTLDRQLPPPSTSTPAPSRLPSPPLR